MTSDRTEYEKLCEEIEEHNFNYFVKNAPLISDFAYDQLLFRVIEIEKRHPDWISPASPTQRVGEAISGGFPVLPHAVPMLSLANTYSLEEIHEFIERMEKMLQTKHIVYETELKMNGIALSVRYEGGKLVRALTRGNGYEGEEVTSNIRTLKAFSSRLGILSRRLRSEGRGFYPKKRFCWVEP